MSKNIQNVFYKANIMKLLAVYSFFIMIYLEEWNVFKECSKLSNGLNENLTSYMVDMILKKHWKYILHFYYTGIF